MKSIPEVIDPRETLRTTDRKDAATDSVIADISISGVLLSSDGTIVGVSKGWKRFATLGRLRLPQYGLGQNYLHHCRSPGSIDVLRGLKKILAGEINLFTALYDCATADSVDWYMLVAAPVSADPSCVAVLHIDLSQFLRNQPTPVVSLIGTGAPSINRLEEIISRSIKSSIFETSLKERESSGNGEHQKISSDQKLIRRLTDTDLKILGYLGTGASNEEIADSRHTTLNTTKAQVATLKKKLNLKNRTQVALFAARNNILVA